MVDLPLRPGAVIGIIGGGQLGRMLALAAARLGFEAAILEPEPDAPAARVAAYAVTAAYDDPEGLKALAALSDVVTFEFENVPAAAVEALGALGVEVAPGALALSTAQDRAAEKTFLNANGAPTVAFRSADTGEEAVAAAHDLGCPVLMKTRREGYDGKGQAWVQSPDEAAEVFAKLGSRPVILEAACRFEREVSVIAARGRDGATAVYPLGENHHEGGVLRRTVAPAAASSELAAEAERIATRILAGLDYVGVIGVELFALADGRLLVNEIAPRVHNTGHWTQDGCYVDQFEQHIRAVAGWPLGPTTAHSRVEMLNLLGEEIEEWPQIAADPALRPHFYGKRHAKPGRKMGHVNRVSALS